MSLGLKSDQLNSTKTHPADAPATRKLSDVVDEIRTDSRQAAPDYLDEVVVPHGGE
jgi:hypothetical protein